MLGETSSRRTCLNVIPVFEFVVMSKILGALFRVIYAFASVSKLFVYIYIYYKLKKIPEGQEYAPRLEP